MGMDITTATRMFYLYVDRYRKLPFIPSSGDEELAKSKIKRIKK